MMLGNCGGMRILQGDMFVGTTLATILAATTHDGAHRIEDSVAQEILVLQRGISM